MSEIARKLIDKATKMPLKKKIELAVTIILVAIVVLLPFLYGTTTYPVAIVQGNSMYPSLQNGDMVLFRSVGQQRIANGTIIVYVQGDTGISSLDALLKPIIIHRVVGSFIQSDGSLYYVTKGDNNNFNDSSAVQANRVLGTPAQVIPKVGFLLLFFSSPQGLVALIGFITLFYLGDYEGKLSVNRKRETFLGAVANMVINDELPEEAFKRFELAVKYVSGEQLEQIKDGLSQALLDWLRKSAREKGWKVGETQCPECSAPVSSFQGSHGEPFIVCPRCIWKKGLIEPVPVPLDTEV